MRFEFLLLFIGMGLVTYIPRVLPFYLKDRLNLSEGVMGPLKLLPCAAIGALILPHGLIIYENAIVSPVALICGAIATWLSDKIPVGILITIIITYALL